MIQLCLEGASGWPDSPQEEWSAGPHRSNLPLFKGAQSDFLAPGCVREVGVCLPQEKQVSTYCPKKSRKFPPTDCPFYPGAQEMNESRIHQKGQLAIGCSGVERISVVANSSSNPDALLR